MICSSSVFSSPLKVLSNRLGIAGATPAGAPARTMKCFSLSAERILQRRKQKKRREGQKSAVDKSNVVLPEKWYKRVNMAGVLLVEAL